MLILQIKQAETALADGRLDEAFEIVKSQHLRQHHRGQKLIGLLSRAFTKRGRENLEAERIQHALADCSKAEKLAGNTEEVALLRADICSEMEQKRIRDQHRSLDLAQAKQHIQDGWISVGQQILEKAEENDSQAGIVARQANMARLQINEVFNKAELALSKDDIESAIDLIVQSGLSNSKNETAFELIFKIKSKGNEKIKTNLNEGRIDLARSLWRKILPLAGGTSQMSEISLVLNHCDKAAEFLAAGEPRNAVSFLKKIKVLCPDAKWLNTALEQSMKAADLLDELAACPLGLEMDKGAFINNNIHMTDKKIRKPVSGEVPTSPGVPNKKAGNTSMDSLLSSRFVMQIDGIGSFLVLRDNKITVGPVSSSAQPTVGLMANPNLPVATIERVEDDYFIRSKSSVQVNDSSVTDKLLVDGDRIALSPRCVMKFQIPNPASTTAVLNLSGTRLGRADIRQVVLMDRDILIGPGKGNHIIAENLDQTVTMYYQNDKLLCKSRQNILVNDAPINSSEGIPVDKQIRIGQISFVLTKM